MNPKPPIKPWRLFWTAVATLVGLVVILLIVGFTITVFYSPPVDRLDRPIAESDEGAIIRASFVYASATRGDFPRDLGSLIADGLLSPRGLIDPRSHRTALAIPPSKAKDAAWIDAHLAGHCDYCYLGHGLTDKAGPKIIVVYTDLWVDDGILIVGYADGRSRQIPLRSVAMRFRINNAARKQLGFPPVSAPRLRRRSGR